MPFEMPDDTCTLFKSDHPDRRDTDPLYTGNAKIAGVEYKASAWIKSSKDGSKRFMQIRFRPKVLPVSPLTAAEATDDEIIW